MANIISKKIQLGKTDIWVSPVGFGVLPMGPGQLALPIDEGARLIVYAVQNGINFIDTAQYYKTSVYIRRAFEMLGITSGKPALNTAANKMPSGSAEGSADCENQGGGFRYIGNANTAEASLGAASCNEPPESCRSNGSDFSVASRAACRNVKQASRNSSELAAESMPTAAANKMPSGSAEGSAYCRLDSSHHSGSQPAGRNAPPSIARPVISSKTLKTDYDGAYNAILEECETLGVPYIDIFLLHEVRSGQLAERQAAWQALKDAKSAGLVRAIGASTHHVDVVEALTAAAECDVIFPLLNYAGMGVRRGSEASSCGDMAAACATACAAGKGIYIMKALGGGNLAPHYQKALDYVFAQPFASSVMLGFGCRKDIDDILAYLDGSMPQDYTPDTSKKRVRVNQEDCEGCGHCISVCHSQAVFYNKKNGLAQIDQSKCITCGYCAQGCPVRAIIMY